MYRQTKGSAWTLGLLFPKSALPIAHVCYLFGEVKGLSFIDGLNKASFIAAITPRLLGSCSVLCYCIPHAVPSHPDLSVSFPNKSTSAEEQTHTHHGGAVVGAADGEQPYSNENPLQTKAPE